MLGYKQASLILYRKTREMTKKDDDDEIIMTMVKNTFNNNDDEIHSVRDDSIQTPSYYTSSYCSSLCRHRIAQGHL